ncbi:MAG: hypothetical protein ACKVP4_13880 [Hyphomicrobium sp.]
MTSYSKLSVAAAFAGLALIKGAMPVSAEGAISLKVFAPAKGISLTVGPKRAIGYFTAKSGHCDLTMMIADAYSDDAPAASTPVRVTTQVPSGSATRVETQSGPALQFVCAPGATTMTVQPVDRLAYAAPAK